LNFVSERFKQSKYSPNLYSTWNVWAIGKIENKHITFEELVRDINNVFSTRELVRDINNVFSTRELAREHREKNIKKIKKYKERLNKSAKKEFYE